MFYSAAAAGGESAGLRERLRSLAREAAGGELGSGEWRAPEDDASGFCSSELESVGEEDVRDGRQIAKHAKLRPTSAKAARCICKSKLRRSATLQQRARARDNNKACLQLRRTWLHWRMATAGQRRTRLACSSSERRVTLLLRPASRVYNGTARRAHICSDTLALASKRGRYTQRGATDLPF